MPEQVEPFAPEDSLGEMGIGSYPIADLPKSIAYRQSVGCAEIERTVPATDVSNGDAP